MERVDKNSCYGVLFAQDDNNTCQNDNDSCHMEGSKLIYAIKEPSQRAARAVGSKPTGDGRTCWNQQADNKSDRER